MTASTTPTPNPTLADAAKLIQAYTNAAHLHARAVLDEQMHQMRDAELRAQLVAHGAAPELNEEYRTIHLALSQMTYKRIKLEAQAFAARMEVQYAFICHMAHDNDGGSL